MAGLIASPSHSFTDLEQDTHGLHDDLHRRGGLREAFHLRDVVLGQAVQRLQSLFKGWEGHVEVGLRVRLHHLHLCGLNSDLRFFLTHLWCRFIG